MRATVLILGALALSLGCDKAEEAAPTDSGPIVRDIGFADTPTAPDVPTPTDRPPATDVPVVTDDGAVDVPGTDTGPTDASCAGDGGCYACAATTSVQLLNHCTAASCARFDNAARLTRLTADGGLPPLP